MKKTVFVVLIMLTMVLSVACKQDEMFPPEKGEFITFSASSLIYQNNGSTLF